MEHSDFILFPKVCVNIRYFSLELCKQMSVSEFCLNWGKNDYVKRNIFEKSLYGKLLILWLCYGCAIYYECVLYIERGTQWIFVDWINVMQFYHRSSKSFFFLQSSYLVHVFAQLSSQSMLLSHRAFVSVLCAVLSQMTCEDW